MGIQILPYNRDDVGQVQAFNGRLRSGGVSDYRLPEKHESTWLPPGGDSHLFEEYFLAKDGEAVRGGYILKHQDFRVIQETRSIGYFYSPVSEGLVDKSFGSVGLFLLLNALKRQPLTYCLGMGGLKNPLPLMLKAAGWWLHETTFLFRVVNAQRFFDNFSFLRRKPAVARILDLLSKSGAGGWGIHTMQRFKSRFTRGMVLPDTRVVASFEEWADSLWLAAQSQYSFCAIRNTDSLNRLYPGDKEKYTKLLMLQEGRPIGWAVALDSKLSNHKHFGNLRLGSIIDVLALPGMENAVAAAATRLLIEQGVDLMVSNQTHHLWCAAFGQSGWLTGPSNFIFASSPKLTRLLEPIRSNKLRMHFNRGDGEGPTHL